MPWSASAATIAAMLLMGCGGRDEVRAPRVVSSLGDEAYGRYDAVGQASWYGDELLGNRTASGAKFDPRAITLAHRTLPLGSFVEVTAIDTGRSIVALVNDRGPWRKGRIADLSRGAAQLLGTDRKSVAMVRLRAITPSAADAAALRSGSRPAARPVFAVAGRVPLAQPIAPILSKKGKYDVQIATFSSKPRALALARALDADLISSGGLWRVQLGPYKGADAVQRARDAVIARGYGDATILPD